MLGGSRFLHTHEHTCETPLTPVSLYVVRLSDINKRTHFSCSAQQEMITVEALCQSVWNWKKKSTRPFLCSKMKPSLSSS